MLIKVIVKNYILIDDLEIDFDAGLNVLTGETGAGKSIILAAIRLALGGRASGQVVRQGASKALIQVVFALDEELSQRLSEYVDVSEEIVIFARELQQNGKSLIKVNDCLVTLQQARQIAALLLSIHGQNDYQSLLDNAGQLQLIDSFLDADGDRAKCRVAELYAQLIAVQRQIEALTIDPAQVERDIDLLKFQIDDIDRAELTEADEDVELEYKKMTKSASLTADLVALRQAIDSDGEWHDATRSLNEVMRLTRQLGATLPEYNDALEHLSDFSYYLAELSDRTQTAIAQLDFDDAARAYLTTRLDTVNALKKKYGRTVELILDYRAGLDARLDDLNQLTTRRQTLETSYDQLHQQYLEAADLLHSARRRAAQVFIAKMRTELAELQFDAAVLDVVFTTQSLAANGSDGVDIVISLNKGMPTESLKKVASGGEVSRIMLAIKNVIAERDAVPVLIFDEIDSGISGLTASVVADKLYRVARHHQVICISHLAQVALMADRHFLIVKDTVDDVAISRVFPLTTEQRIEQIARLTSGKLGDAALRQQADNMLQRARQNQQKIIEQMRS